MENNKSVSTNLRFFCLHIHCLLHLPKPHKHRSSTLMISGEIVIRRARKKIKGVEPSQAWIIDLVLQTPALEQSSQWNRKVLLLFPELSMWTWLATPFITIADALVKSSKAGTMFPDCRWATARLLRSMAALFMVVLCYCVVWMTSCRSFSSSETLRLWIMKTDNERLASRKEACFCCRAILWNGYEVRKCQLTNVENVLPTRIMGPCKSRFSSP